MTLSKTFSSELVSSNRYVVRMAESDADLEKAQALRYRVFNLELGEGLDRSHKYKLDKDEYDDQCDHLLVVERNTDDVIGTYRMQTYQTAKKNRGFYTSDEYKIDELPEKMLDKSVEVGRACIHKDHRNGRVLYLLWRGIAEYMKITGSRYLFGCCSITSTNPADGWIVMEYLKENGLTHDDISLDTKGEYRCPPTDHDSEAWKKVKLPQLFRLYIDLGAKVLSKPALDKNFKTIDFLILVDVEELDERSKALFMR